MSSSAAAERSTRTAQSKNKHKNTTTTTMAGGANEGFTWKAAADFLFPPDPVPVRRVKKQSSEDGAKNNGVGQSKKANKKKQVIDEPELKEEETKAAVVTKVVVEVPDDIEGSDDWEILSGRHSITSLEKGGVVVAKAGSVRSINSMSDMSGELSGSVPFKIQRTLSSSTIDSENGDRTLGLKGVDYVEHIVLPTDTLQGICLAYKISGTRLRQANHFSGSNLSGAPKKLIVPLSKTAIRTGFIRVQDTETREFKLHAFLAELPDLRETEATGYLELADWIVSEAVRSAKEDLEWEQEIGSNDAKAGAIQIKVKRKDGVAVGFETMGAGLSKHHPPRPEKVKRAAAKKKVEISEGVPAIATKTVRPQDVYDAAPQHNGFGVELKPISRSSSQE
eukprot:CAMPEP_0194028374 /NCGR_PEP_ID=MMETSP0009_2-20130614/2357_1 /TAXON_ID=210454 /ORGANISM="Grammatophora oceanica, Strain CCMP 410" /LENGTH=392 /DNA_ID=CAMNT_0038667745 /DNA_START=113 /DNA_END=1291 /DNA_ORIENTATION=+